METTVFSPDFSNTLLVAPTLASMDETGTVLPFGGTISSFDTLEAAKTPLDDDEEDEDEDDDIEDEDEDDDLEDDDDLDDEDEDDDLEDDDDDEDEEDDEEAEDDDDPKPLRVKTRT